MNPGGGTRRPATYEAMVKAQYPVREPNRAPVHLRLTATPAAIRVEVPDGRAERLQPSPRGPSIPRTDVAACGEV
jgi:hypothetical protein